MADEIVDWQQIVKDLVTARDNFLQAVEGKLEDLAAGAVPATATDVLGAVGQAWAANQLEMAWEAAEAALAASA
jgi:hypothetical protein